MGMPKIRIQGPFGGGNQDWYKFEVAVMIGAGIGVTPYASILNDLVFGTSTNRYSGVACKKVYFIWICPSHRNFEWFIDVLREVERKDVTNVLEMHIFITQFFHKFDLRTTMLYICENHFQRLSKRSLFTGLKASNHFGRPDMSVSKFWILWTSRHLTLIECWVTLFPSFRTFRALKVKARRTCNITLIIWTMVNDLAVLQTSTTVLIFGILTINRPPTGIACIFAGLPKTGVRKHAIVIISKKFAETDWSTLVRNLYLLNLHRVDKVCGISYTLCDSRCCQS